MTATQTRTVELVVPGICCTECMQSVDIALRRAPGVQTLRILGTAEKVQVTYDDAMTIPEDVVRVVEWVGHPVQSWRPARGQGDDTLDGDAGGRQADPGRETCAGWLAHPGPSQGYVPSNCLFRSSRVP